MRLSLIGFLILTFLLSGSGTVFAATPNDPLLGSQYYLSQINAISAWDKTTGSRDVVVAVIDTGVDIDHPDLKENIWINTDEIPRDGVDNDGNGFIDDINGWDFLKNEPDPRPKIEAGYTAVALNHGTLIAGIIGGMGGNGEGIAGINWRVSIMPIRALNHIGLGDTLVVSQAINYAVANGANVINLSFVGVTSDSRLETAIKNAYEKDVIVVAAAGNEGHDFIVSDLDLVPHYPVCHDGGDGVNRVLGVAGVDQNDTKAFYSNYGIICIDISSPGTQIMTTQFFEPALEGFREYYTSQWSGTSLSTPMVSGALALMKSYRRDLSMREIRDALLTSSDSIDAKNFFYIGELGRGRLNIARALSALDLYPKTSNTPAEPQQEPGGNSNSFFYTLSNSGSASLLTTWTEMGELVNEVSIPEKFSQEQSFISGALDDGSPHLVFGSNAGGAPHVSFYELVTGKLARRFEVFPNSFLGGVNVTMGDIDGNGQQEIIVAPRSGGGPQIRIFDLGGNLLGQFFADAPTLRGGYNIGVSDITGDGIDDIIFNRHGSASAKVFSNRGKSIFSFTVTHPSVRTGVRFIGGDVTGDARAEILVSSISRGAPIVHIYGNDGKLIKKIDAYNKAFLGGVSIGLNDNNNDGILDIVTGAGPGGGPHIRFFDGSGNLLRQFFAGEATYRGGVSVITEVK